MTSPARSQPTPSAFTPLTDAAAESVREPSPELREALLRDQSDLQREVILWQRWVRAFAILVLAAVGSLVSSETRGALLLTLLAVVSVYVASVFLTGWAVRRNPILTTGPWLPGLLVTTDLFAIGAIIYLTGMPLVANRFLVLALLSVTLAAFYFGRALAVYSILLAISIYLAIAQLPPPVLAGP